MDLVRMGKLALIGYVGAGMLNLNYALYGAAAGAGFGYMVPSKGGMMETGVNVAAGASAGLLLSDAVDVSPMVGAAAGGAGAYFLLQ